MFKKGFLLLGFGIACLLSAQTFEVTQESEDHLIIRFNLPEYTLETNEFSGLSEINCSAAAFTAEKGLPNLPFFNEIVGIPVDGDIVISTLEFEQETIDNVKIKPAQGIIDPESRSTRYSRSQRLPEYDFRIYPQNMIKKQDNAFIGDRHFCGFNIYPFQYKAGSNQLLVTSQIRFRIDILGDKTSSRNYLSSNNLIDEVADDFFINNKFSRKWRKERTPATSYPPRSGDLVEEVQFVVDEEGIYKVTYESLTDALADPSLLIEFEMAFEWGDIDPRYLELSDENGSVPINFVGEADGSFDAGDYFEFFGERHPGDEGYYDDYTSENVYTLKLVDYLGSRMAVENGGLSNINPEQYIIPESFQQTIHFEKQNVKDGLGAQYDWTSTNYYREDIWFWEKINAPTLKIYSFDLQYPHESAIRHFDAKVCLFGSTYNDSSQTHYEKINHSAQININSSFIDQHEWFGQNEQMFENEPYTLSNQRLNHGTNNLYVSAPGIPGIENDQLLFDYFDLTYWREYKTDEDFIRFTKPQNKPLGLYNFIIDNFSSDSISVYKLGSSFMENLQINSFLQNGGAPYSITFQDSIFSEGTEYFAVTEAQKKQPKKIRPNIPSNLRGANNLAEYVIITLQRYTENEYLLEFLQLWQSQGVNAKIVALEDIFDEFNSGIRSVQSIKDFISYAYNNWNEPRLSQVLLLGDGLFDERDDSSNRNYNLIPFKRLWVQKRGAISSDNWVGCIVGDDIVPDVGISRISIWNEAQIEDVVNKSIHYVNNPNYEDMWHSKAIFAAGGNPSEGTYFAKQSERIIDKYLPKANYSKRVYCNTEDLPDGYGGNTTELISTINDGALYVQFMGHGGGYVWADYNLLNKADVMTFNNENYPFFNSLSCYGSAFGLPQSSSIGEEVVLAPEKGGIAHFGFSGYGYKENDEYFGNFMNDAIFQKKISSIGAIVNYTKAKFYGSYGQGTTGKALIGGGVLLGDPMINLLHPFEETEVYLDQYNVTEGDTISMTSPVHSSIDNGQFIIFDEDDVQLPLNEYYPFELPAINDTISTSDFIVPQSPYSIYTNYIKVIGYGDEGEIRGFTNFTVGQTAVSHLTFIPEIPAAGDSILIQADFFDQDGIESITCLGDNNTDIPMINTDGATYITESAIQPLSPGYDFDFFFRIVDANQDTTNTEYYQFEVVGPDLTISHIELTENDFQPALKVLVQNTGSTVSPQCEIKLYNYSDSTYFGSQTFAALEELDNRWVYLELPTINDNIRFRVVINENEESFPEIHSNNNQIYSPNYILNTYELSSDQLTASSLDGNLNCAFPENMLSTETIVYIDDHDILEPINQPDVANILLADSTYSNAYEIGIYNTSLLADTLGHFPNDKKITLEFNYHPTDSLTQLQENEDNFLVYRWEKDFEKWIWCGGGTLVDEDVVIYETDRCGIYTILQNNDSASPFIEANVQGQEFTQSITSSGQEFTYGGYISKNGIISFLLLDTNGIDVFNHPIELFISDGVETTQIDRNEYSLSITHGNLTKVPMKYALNGLSRGTYTITLDCFDVNGNTKTLQITFDVNDEFDVINFANYPNPVKSQTVKSENEGRTRFTYVLTDDADKVKIKVYTVSGRLVKTFKHLPASVGYHEYPRAALGWDCRDDDGFYLANGVYFYRIIAEKGNKKIEKTQKMAILK